jgi:anti-sigma regulatory factor (Ser/Thr protein kinase)
MAGTACNQDAHCALFYRDDQEYLDGVRAFLEPARIAGEPVAVAVPAAKQPLLGACLDDLGVPYQLLDLAEVGRNPARVILTVSDVLSRHEGSPLHFVGEPIWPGRPRDEVNEAARHDALINLAWPGAAIRVLCPYDEVHLDAEVLRAAEATHPAVSRSGRCQMSSAYQGREAKLPGEELEPAPPAALTKPFGSKDLSALRRTIRERARRRGLDHDRAADLALAVDELATNTIRHADGWGRLRMWDEPDRIVCEVEDSGHITDPLAGRRRPPHESRGGMGLWAVNQLCDLVQMRSGPHRTIVRVHMTLG